MGEEDWYNAYKSFDVTDDDGNTVNVGGSRVFNLADAATYVGITGGKDSYKSVYNTFGAFCVEAYPEVLPKFEPYEQATDWTYLRAAYNKNKGQAGTASKAEFNKGDRITQTVANASYSIEFETGSDRIKPSSYKMLDELADQLVVSSNLLVEISGHTDNTGTDEVNIPLSEARARAVEAYFENKDPDLADRTIAKGYGSTKPISDNTTVAGKQKNRRVEIRLGRK
jgi:OOP family OmpA-OmpF porin